jgi:hypothetical protein
MQTLKVKITLSIYLPIDLPIDSLMVQVHLLSITDYRQLRIAEIDAQSIAIGFQ